MEAEMQQEFSEANVVPRAIVLWVFMFRRTEKKIIL